METETRDPFATYQSVQSVLLTSFIFFMSGQNRQAGRQAGSQPGSQTAKQDSLSKNWRRAGNSPSQLMKLDVHCHWSWCLWTKLICLQPSSMICNNRIIRPVFFSFQCSIESVIAFLLLVGECALSTAGGATNLGKIYPVYLAISHKKTAWNFAIPRIWDGWDFVIPPSHLGMTHKVECPK